MALLDIYEQRLDENLDAQLEFILSNQPTPEALKLEQAKLETLIHYLEVDYV
jgi:hypothetical protein